MYMKPRCTGMLRHLPLLTFVELTDSKYSMIFLLHSWQPLDVMLAFVNMLLLPLWYKVLTNAMRFADGTVLRNKHRFVW